jgi:UDP-N-acetylmuramate dehydrogenase
MQRIITYLNQYYIYYEENVDLKKYSYSKTGRQVNLIIYPNSVNQLVRFLDLAVKEGLEYKVIGNTTNLLFSDSVIYSAFINLKKLNSIDIDFNGNYIVGSGVELSELSRFFLSQRLSGFEGLEGIPGTLGGAITMNAGAYGYSISRYVESCQFIEFGHLKTISKPEMKFSKRNSIFLNSDKIIVSVTFKGINKAPQESIEKKMRVFHAARHSYQEFNYPNLGSIFCLDDNIHNLLLERGSYWSIIKYKIINYTFYNKFARVFKRKDPTDFDLTLKIIKYLSLNLDVSLISKKNLNTFINNDYKTLRLIEHFEKLYDLVDDKTRIKLENEYVNQAVLKVIDEDSFRLENDTYRYIKND